MSDKEFEEYYKKTNYGKAIVVSLEDAIESIKEGVRDEYNSQEEDY